MRKNNAKSTAVNNTNTGNDMSKSVRVVKILTFGDKGNIIVDNDATEKAGKRVLLNVSRVVGYIAKNIGKTNINVRVYEYKQNAAGVYEGTYVYKAWKAGTEMVFNKSDLMYLASREEFSFAFENGAVYRASGINKALQRIKDGDTSAEAKRELLNKYYFKFSDKMSVNDSSVTLRIDDNNVVKDQYLSAFGWLANKKVRKNAKQTVRDKQVESAAELRQLLDLTENDTDNSEE